MIRKAHRIPLLLTAAAAVLTMVSSGGAVASASTANPPPNPPNPGFALVQTDPSNYPGYSSSPAPFFSTGSTGAISANSLPGGNYEFYWPPDGYNSGWRDSAGVTYWYTTTYKTSDVDVFGGGWSLLQDDGTGDCLTYDGGTNQIYDKPCNAAKPSEQWASSPVAGSGCGGSCNLNWYVWNRYLKEADPNDCGNTYAPVVTINSAGAKLIMECPEGNSTTYTANQTWEGDGV